MRQIDATPISAAAFAPYGDLLAEAPDRRRTDFVADLVNLRPTARLNLAFVRAEIVATPLRVTEMDRHAFSAQSFLPLDVERYLVVVAQDDGTGRPDPATVAAFRVDRPHGINYHPGIWHIGMVALAGAGRFALLVHEDGSPDDCHFSPVEPFEIALSD